MSLSAANKNIKNNHISSRSGSSTPTSFAQSIVSSSTDLSSSSSSTTSSSCCSSSASSQAMVVAMMIANSVVVVPAVPSAASKVRRPQIPRTMPHDINCSSKTSKNGRFCATTTPCTCMFNRIIMTTLLLLNLVLLPHTVHAAPAASGYSRTVHVPIGSVFTLDVGVDGRTASPPSPDGFPGWARLNDSASQVYGIPQANDVGVYTIPLQERTVRVEVGNELKQRCEQEIKTIWLEIVDQQRIDELPMESQFNSVKSLLAKLNVRLADVRLFPFSYLDTYRTITEIMHELEQYQQQHPQQGQQKIHGQQIVYSVNISCGELNEQSSEVISAAIENGLSFQPIKEMLKLQPKWPSYERVTRETRKTKISNVIDASRTHANSMTMNEFVNGTT